MIVRTVTVLVLLAALAACGEKAGSTGGGGAGSPGPTEDLAGKTFVVTGITDSGKARPVVDGSEVRLAFADDRLMVTAGCNTLTGGYALDGDRLTVDPLAMTQMGCEPALMAQDSWLAGLFEKPVRLTASATGAVTGLTSGTVVLDLADRATVSPDRALEGTRWALDTIVTGDAASSVPSGVTAWLEIKNGNVVLNDGCNNGRGTAASTPTTITFGPRATTRMACPGSEQVQRAFATVLDGETTYRITEGSLRITRGGEALGFTAAGAAVGAG